MAWDAMNPLLLRSNDGDNQQRGIDIERKNHVIISLGVSNSGKTYTIFGENASAPEVLEDSIKTSSSKFNNERVESNEGIVPRIINDLFFAEEDKNIRRMLMQKSPKRTGDDTKNVGEVKFGVQISMVHVHNDRVFDMLSFVNNENLLGDNKKLKTSKKKKVSSNVLQLAASFETKSINTDKALSMETLRISQNPQTHDFVVNPKTITCCSSSHARQVLRLGMKQSMMSSTTLNECSSRGHTIITLKPILSKGDDESQNIIGGSITIIDLAGIERTKTSCVSGKKMKESVAINNSVFVVLQCLRSIQQNYSKKVINSRGRDLENQSPNLQMDCQQRSRSPKKIKMQIIPYRQNKLTMLMQPFLSGSIERPNNSNVSKFKTNILLLVSAYPGSIDYNEKRSLFNEIDKLRGLSISHTKTHTVMEEHDKAVTAGSPSIELDTFKTSEMLNEESLASSEGYFDINMNQNQGHIENRSSTKSSPLKRISNMMTSISGKKRRATETENERLIEKIKSLEEENASLFKENKAVKVHYKTSMEENRKLRKFMEEAEKREADARQEAEANRIKSREYNEESHRRARKVRISAQNLLKSPLRQHMKKVENQKNLHSGIVGDGSNNPQPFHLNAPENHLPSTTKDDEEIPSILKFIATAKDGESHVTISR